MGLENGDNGCLNICDDDVDISHVLVHFVKSACLYSVNPFSTLFSANIQHNCPILFGICPTYLPAGLAFRFSFQKQLHLHFQGKWPLAPSSFEWTNVLFSLLCLESYWIEWKIFGKTRSAVNLLQRLFATSIFCGVIWYFWWWLIMVLIVSYWSQGVLSPRHTWYLSDAVLRSVLIGFGIFISIFWKFL